MKKCLKNNTFMTNTTNAVNITINEYYYNSCQFIYRGELKATVDLCAVQ